VEVWDLVAAERSDLADLLDGLAPQQWDTRSLCEGWRVRDVVGHLIGGAVMTTGSAVTAMVKAGFRTNVMLDREARRIGACDVDELRRRMRDTIASRRTPPGVKPVDVLVDTVVHREDIRRPLGMISPIPEETLRLVAERAKETGASYLPAKRRITGLRLEASDIDWSTGHGPGVRGPAEALVMAMSGRRVALADLTGDGLDTLASRI
jgi:uncharacterized protein (TIGR03083 family)